MDHREIIDRLTIATEEVQSLKEAPPPLVPKERVLRLKYRRGQRVKDKVTGLEGEVIDGAREVVKVQGP